jgi:hypothetical protein
MVLPLIVDLPDTVDFPDTVFWVPRVVFAGVALQSTTRGRRSSPMGLPIAVLMS